MMQARVFHPPGPGLRIGLMIVAVAAPGWCFPCTAEATPSRPEMTRSDFSDTAFADGSWKLSDPLQRPGGDGEDSLMAPDKHFDWDLLDQRFPMTWELQEKYRAYNDWGGEGYYYYRGPHRFEYSFEFRADGWHWMDLYERKYDYWRKSVPHLKLRPRTSIGMKIARAERLAAAELAAKAPFAWRKAAPPVHVRQTMQDSMRQQPGLNPAMQEEESARLKAILKNAAVRKTDNFVMNGPHAYPPVGFRGWRREKTGDGTVFFAFREFGIEPPVGADAWSSHGTVVYLTP